MKLKKLMRKKFINFPDGANYATQDKDGTISFWVGIPCLLGASWCLGDCVAYTRTRKLASNWRARIVRRDELED